MQSVRCSVTRTVMLGLIVVHGALVHGAHSTPSVQSATALRGLSGVIGDTTFQAIAGARIHVNTSIGAPLAAAKHYKYSTRINDLSKGGDAKPRDGSLPKDAQCPGARIGVWLRH